MTDPNTRTLRFLGTGASAGVPSYYCGCKACEEALRNPSAQRGCSGLLIIGAENTLIDVSPDLRMQLSVARAKHINRALITHEHFDHIGGIPQLEYYVRLVSKEPFPLYAGSHTLSAIAQQFEFMSETLEPHVIETWQSLVFDGVRYTALPATHGTQTFGFIIEKDSNAGADSTTSHKRVAYFPDTGPLCAEVMEELAGIDVLIIDATFNGSNWMPASHHSIEEAILLAQQLEAKKTFLTHLAMHYDEPITALELQQELAQYEGAILAANDGLEITL